METLWAMVDEVLAEAASGPAGLRPPVQAVRSRLGSVHTVVVVGRRGVGKTSLINGLLGFEADSPGFSAVDQPVRLFTSGQEPGQVWARATQLDASVLRGRRLIELPEHLSAQPDTLTQLKELCPDVVVYLAQEELRIDEIELLHRLQGEWMLGPLEVLMVLVDPVSIQFASESRIRLAQLRDRQLIRHRGLFAQVVLGGDRSTPVIGALAVADTYAGARRAGEAMQEFTHLAARCDDRAWSADVLDKVERVALTPQAHIWREMWAIEECLRGTAQLPPELLADLVEFYLPSGSEVSGQVERPTSADLALRATRWRSAGNRLPPRAAEVARIVLRSSQLQMTGIAHTPASIASQVIRSTPDVHHAVV